MKKILALLLVLSIVLAFAACDLLPGKNPGENPGGDENKPGADTGIDSEGSTDIFDTENNGNGGINLPIIDVNSEDMRQPEDDGTSDAE